MAYEVPGVVLGTLMAPTTAYYGYQFYGVAASTVEGYIALPSTAGGAQGNRLLGILQNKPKAIGDACAVMISGVSKVRIGANSSNMHAGTNIVFKSDGLAYSSTNAVDGDLIVGPVLTTNSSAAGYITVVLNTWTHYTT